MTALHGTALIGLFVGGKARRMGGIPKGLLAAPSESRSIAARLSELCLTVAPHSRLVLVGDASSYGELGLDSIADEPSGVGPLGGLQALLKYGESQGSPHVFSLACDLPYVTAPLLERLFVEHADAIALAPRSQGRWQPFFARFEPASVRPRLGELLSRNQRALQALFEALGADARELLLTPHEESLLRDWDTPEDVHG